VKKAIFALALLTTPALAQQPPMGQMGQMPQMPNLEEMFFKQFDNDSDGAVSKAEFLKPTEAQFDHMDRDKNGALDRQEVKAFNDEMTNKMQEMARQMQQQRGGQQR